MMRAGTIFSGIGAPECSSPDIDWRWAAEIDPFACAVHKARFPNVPNLGDITSVDWHAVEPVDLVVGGPPCFTADTLILARRGLVPIEDIVIGDEVITHELHYRRVTAVMRREADTVVLKGQGHFGIETTAEHPFWAREVAREWVVGSKAAGGPQWRRTRREPEWVEAADLVGKFWSSPSQFPATDPAKDAFGQLAFEFADITPAFAWVLGAWLGDGWVRLDRKNASLIICASKSEAHELQTKLLEAGFDANTSEERTTYRFTFGDRALTEWVVANFGKGAVDKTIPPWLLGAPVELRSAFFNGYLFADGATIKAKGGGTVHSFTTVSKKIAIGFRLLTNTLDLSSSLHFTERPPRTSIEGREVNQRSTYQIRVFESARSAFRDNGMMWGKVKSLKPGQRAEVFNIEVEEDNSYVADGLCVHNCQDYSVAGQRASLGGARGDLTLQYARILDAIDPAWSVTENVPGWLSTPDNAFGAFLGILVGADAALVPGRGQRWTDAGVVSGAKRSAAWRICDAQFWGVPQRRRRVFVVACRGAGNFACAEALFPLRESLRRDTAPRRETREDIAVTIAPGAHPGGVTGRVAENGALIALRGHSDYGDGLPSLRFKSGDCGGGSEALIAFGGNNTAGPIDIATACNAHGGRLDFESETFVAYGGNRYSGPIDVATACNGSHVGVKAFEYETLIAHSLRADDFDASEDGTGRGTPLIPVLDLGGNKGMNGGGWVEGFTPPLGTNSPHAVLMERSHEMVGMGAGTCGAGVHHFDGLRANGAVSFHENQRAEITLNDTAGSLKVGGGKPGQGYPAIAVIAENGSDIQIGDGASTGAISTGQRPGHADNSVAAAMQVRRLLPVETERLQGFPDNWTDVPYRGKQAADGNRYRAVGNSMAVPVIGWVLSRVQQAAAASLEAAA